MKQDIIFNQDSDEVFKQAAEKMAYEINLLAQKQEVVTLAVCGGRSAATLFEELQTQNVEWEKVHFFMVDERMVQVDDDEANFKILNENLIQPLLREDKISEEQVHPFFIQKEEEDNGVDDYTNKLQDYKECFDIVMLSSGEDGHVAALFPNHSSIEDPEQFFIQMDDSPKDPPHRMSASRKLILASKVAFLFFIGDGKKDAFANYTNAELTLQQCPAKLANYIPQSYVCVNIQI